MTRNGKPTDEALRLEADAEVALSASVDHTNLDELEEAGGDIVEPPEDYDLHDSPPVEPGANDDREESDS